MVRLTKIFVDGTGKTHMTSEFYDSANETHMTSEFCDRANVNNAHIRKPEATKNWLPSTSVLQQLCSLVQSSDGLHRSMVEELSGLMETLEQSAAPTILQSLARPADAEAGRARA